MSKEETPQEDISTHPSYSYMPQTFFRVYILTHKEYAYNGLGNLITTTELKYFYLKDGIVNSSSFIIPLDTPKTTVTYLGVLSAKELSELQKKYYLNKD